MEMEMEMEMAGEHVSDITFDATTASYHRQPAVAEGGWRMAEAGKSGMWLRSQRGRTSVLIASGA